MSVVLDRDFGADSLARFGGRLYRATLTKELATIDPAHPTSTIITDTPYVCDAISFGYREEFVDGERVKKGDYRVVIIRTSIGTSNNDAVAASLNLGALLPNANSVLKAKSPTYLGAIGSYVVVVLVGDAVSGPGSYSELVDPVDFIFVATFHFDPGVTTVAQLEALLAGSTLLALKTPGTPTNVLQAGDALGPTPLAGGTDATVSPADVVPNPGDKISIPPPGEATAITGRIVEVVGISEAQITVQARGRGEG